MNPYQPMDLPPANLDFRRLLPLTGAANRALARYDGLLQSIPNPAVMLAPLTTQEAVLSSRIEGTQATIDEVLEQDAGLPKEGEKFEDIQEIINYRKALGDGRRHLEDYPIHRAFLRQLHRTLMTSVRGQDKTPGEFRKTQNWIGAPGCSIEQATFVPPNPLQLPVLLEAWERYVADTNDDVLLQTAVVHAQFELLHPFNDGNGRIGRILIPLLLYQKRALSQPMFYLSEYLEGHREIYYRGLQAISSMGDWTGWIAFFLEAVRVQAEGNCRRVAAIKKLYDQTLSQVQGATHSQHVVQLVDAVFRNPIFKTPAMAQRLHQKHQINEKTANLLLRKMRDAGILDEIHSGSGRRAAVLRFTQLMHVAEGRDAL